VQRLQQVLPSGKDGFDVEYEELVHHDEAIKRQTAEYFTALLPHNYGKNRYDDVLANESTRCQVVGVKSEDDYINANFVDPVGTPTCYICSQAPLPNTFGDFWNVVWYYGSRIILMLCSETENGQPKCDRYWPARVGASERHGDFKIVCVAEDKPGAYVLRTFDVSNALNGEVRRVYQYHYLDWPDFGVPADGLSMIDMLRAVDKVNARFPEDDGRFPPVVIHCSAGIGRTGTLIAVHTVLERFEAGEDTNVFEVVKQLKEERTGMVQRKEQYVFIYKTVLQEMHRMMAAANANASAAAAAAAPQRPNSVPNGHARPTGPPPAQTPTQSYPSNGVNGVSTPNGAPSGAGSMTPAATVPASGAVLYSAPQAALPAFAGSAAMGPPTSYSGLHNGHGPYAPAASVPVLNGSPAVPQDGRLTSPRMPNPAANPAAAYAPRGHAFPQSSSSLSVASMAAPQYPPAPVMKPIHNLPTYNGTLSYGGYTFQAPPAPGPPPNPHGPYKNPAASYMPQQRYSGGGEDRPSAAAEEEWRGRSRTNGQTAPPAGGTRRRSASAGRMRNSFPQVARTPPRRQPSPSRPPPRYEDHYDNRDRGGEYGGYGGYQDSAPLREEPRGPRTPYNYHNTYPEPPYARTMIR
jgi:protein tyrosine phosphatase